MLAGGCAKKSEEVFNKPDIFWYNKMVEAIAKGDVERADDYFVSLQSEHFSSVLVPEAMLILAQAHMDEEEYLLAKYYLDEYLKRYATPQDREFVEFLKIKASYLAFRSINRDQKLLRKTIQEAQKYLRRYPQAPYAYMVQTILGRLSLARDVLQKEAAALYRRMGKEEAAKIYMDRLGGSWTKDVPAEVPKSWYDYLLGW
jgi:outer membrane protein assembly factor BamD